MFETVGSGTSSLLACSISRSQLECICCSESLVAMYSSIFDMENIFWGKYEAMLGLLVMIELYNKLPYILTKTHVEWSLIKFLLQFKRPLHSRDNRIWANYGNISNNKNKPCNELLTEDEDDTDFYGVLHNNKTQLTYLASPATQLAESWNELSTSKHANLSSNRNFY